MTPARSTLTLLLLVIAARPLGGQLVPIMNASFDSNLAGWIQNPAESSYWNVPDADSCSPGGKAVLFNDFDQIIKLHQCLLLSGSAPLTVLARTRGFAGVDNAQVLKVTFYADTACSSFIDNVLDFASSDTWTELRIDLPSPPANTASIEISLEVLQNGSFPAWAEMDEVRVARSPLLFADGFEAGAPCRWLPSP